MMNSRDYRVSARTHAAKAVKLMTGRPGLTPDQQDQLLKAATQHLATAMAHAAAAVAAREAEQEKAVAVDIPAATDDVVQGLEALLELEAGK